MDSTNSTQQLLQRLARLYPDYGPSELLRMGLLVSLHAAEFDRCDNRGLEESCQQISMRMSAAGDQHAAVSDELDSLAAAAPCDFSPAHIWALVRAIKVQSQVLNLYLGPVVSKAL